MGPNGSEQRPWEGAQKREEASHGMAKKGKKTSSEHQENCLKSKSGITPREIILWSRRQAGAIRPVRRAD